MYAGEELERDLLREYGVVLTDFVKGRLPWGMFLRLVDGLPVASEYKSKILQDESLVDESLLQEREEQLEQPELSFVNETEVVRLLRDVVDQLALLTWVQGGTSKKPPEPGARPVTAVERAREAARVRSVDEALRVFGLE